jgi:hypothetical protein
MGGPPGAGFTGAQPDGARLQRLPKALAYGGTARPVAGQTVQRARCRTVSRLARLIAKAWHPARRLAQPRPAPPLTMWRWPRGGRVLCRRTGHKAIAFTGALRSGPDARRALSTPY